MKASGHEVMEGVNVVPLASETVVVDVVAVNLIDKATVPRLHSKLKSPALLLAHSLTRLAVVSRWYKELLTLLSTPSTRLWCEMHPSKIFPTEIFVSHGLALSVVLLESTCLLLKACFVSS